MNSVLIGHKAELAAAKTLKARGYRILTLNWRTKYCEIDIIAWHNGIPIFVEVKYRASETSGSGLDYITAKKIQHMKRAADFWVRQHSYSGEYQLAAIEVTGEHYEVGELVDDLYS